jgi:hypothetical protein
MESIPVSGFLYARGHYAKNREDYPVLNLFLSFPVAFTRPGSFAFSGGTAFS